MSTADLYRRAILTAGVIFAASQLPACQSLDAAFDAPTLKAGESVCTGTSAECAELRAIAADLHTPEMERRIAEALR